MISLYQILDSLLELHQQNISVTAMILRISIVYIFGIILRPLVLSFLL